ncbi:MAG: hypothetical protein QXO57_02510 [Candidatus Aenigmatarchaeota archaeon]
MKKYRKDEIINWIKVAKFIQTYPNTYLTEICRELELDKKTVIKALKKLEKFLIKTKVKDLVPVPVPNLPIYLRFKEGFNLQQLEQELARQKKVEKIMEVIKK